MVVSPNNCLDVTLKGQNLSDADVLVVHDASLNEVRKTSLANFYNSYLNAKLSHPEGPVGSVQLRGRKGFAANANLVYDSSSDTLQISGETKTNLLTTMGQSIFPGVVKNRSAVHNNIITISQEVYDVADADYTILCDTTKNKIKDDGTGS